MEYDLLLVGRKKGKLEKVEESILQHSLDKCRIRTGI